MGCAASAPAGAALDAGAPPTAQSAAQAAALAEPPLPHTQQLLGGLAKALELEYGPPNEAGAVQTWVTLELEARPSSHFDEAGTSLQACLEFVAAVESAVKEKALTTDVLREKWGCPSEAPRRQPSGPVDLADVVAGGMGSGSADSWVMRAEVGDAPKKSHSSTADDDADSMSDGDDSLRSERDVLPEDDDNPDGFAAGDGRYR